MMLHILIGIMIGVPIGVGIMCLNIITKRYDHD